MRQSSKFFSLNMTLCICLSIQGALARFTLETCWGKDCILRTPQNTLCFIPSAAVAATQCTQTHADFASVLKVHLGQDLSIAYYNGVDNTRLGGIDYTVPGDGSIIRLCLSGQAVDGSFATLCLNAVGDNRLEGSSWCEVGLVPKAVSDGCYSTAVTSTATTTAYKNGGVHGVLRNDVGIHKLHAVIFVVYLLLSI